MIHPTPTSFLLLMSPQRQPGRVYDTQPVLYSPAPWRASPRIAMAWTRMRRAQTAPAVATRPVPGCASGPRLRRASVALRRRDLRAGGGRDHGAHFQRRGGSAGSGP
jgi:hypothetical protein